MKVCFLAGTLGQGGAERQLLYMLQALKKIGVETRVICLTKGEIYESKIEALGVEIEYVGASKSRVFRVIEIIKSLRNDRVNIIQSSHFYTNIYAAIAGKLLKIKSIGAIRNDLISEINADKIFGKWQIKLPDHLIANSKLGFERAKNFGVAGDKIDFVRNAVNLETNSSNNSEAEKRLNILFIGRLSEQKRPEIFIELAVYLKKELPEYDLHFQMVGEGNLSEKLKQQAKDYKLTEDEFVFFGNQQNVTAFYQNADLFILPSKFEGTPNVLLEAMAFGLPIVATRVGGIPEIVSDECGILVSPEDKLELFESVKKLVLDKSLRKKFSEAGKKYVGRNHSLDSLKEQLIQVYRKILA